MVADVEVVSTQSTRAYIPMSAVLARLDEFFVFVQSAQDTFASSASSSPSNKVTTSQSRRLGTQRPGRDTQRDLARCRSERGVLKREFNRQDARRTPREH
jgi:hypothetical protein